jgi:hypothetical protein
MALAMAEILGQINPDPLVMSVIMREKAKVSMKTIGFWG